MRLKIQKRYLLGFISVSLLGPQLTLLFNKREVGNLSAVPPLFKNSPYTSEKRHGLSPDPFCSCYVPNATLFSSIPMAQLSLREFKRNAAAELGRQCNAMAQSSSKCTECSIKIPSQLSQVWEFLNFNILKLHRFLHMWKTVVAQLKE